MPRNLLAVILAAVVLAGCSSAQPPDASNPPVATTFFDDFSAKPDGPLITGAKSTSGHTYSVLGQIPWQVVGGRLTHSQSNTASAQSSYLGVDLHAEVSYVWAEYEVPPGADPQEAIVLIVSESKFTAANYQFANAAAHCVFSDSSFRCDSIEAVDGGLKTTLLRRDKYPSLVPGVYRVEVSIEDDRITVTTPDGKRLHSEGHNTIKDWSGPWATLQLNNPANGVPLKELRVLRWGAVPKR